jgi:peptidyl-prolyl cis-trans isomerase SurA
MKKNNFFKLFILIFFLISNISVANIKNDIVLKVGNQIITEYDIKNKILTTLFLNKKEYIQENIDGLKRVSLELLVLNKLKKIELSKYNIQGDQKQIISYLKNISSSNVEGLKNEFKSNNLDYNLFLEEIETEFSWQKLIYQTYSDKIKIDEKKIDEEIKLKIKNPTQEEIKLSKIEILSINELEDKNNIDKIKNNIIKEGFEKTSSKFSMSSSAFDKGDIGWINSNQLSKKIYDEVKKIKIGEISAPIKDQDTILILKLIDKRNSSNISLDIEKLKKNLIEKKKNEMFNLYSRSLLSKLKNKTFIQYK